MEHYRNILCPFPIPQVAYIVRTIIFIHVVNIIYESQYNTKINIIPSSSSIEETTIVFIYNEVLYIFNRLSDILYSNIRRGYV